MLLKAAMTWTLVFITGCSAICPCQERSDTPRKNMPIDWTTQGVTSNPITFESVAQDLETLREKRQREVSDDPPVVHLRN
jgi:hypothetical protein